MYPITNEVKALFEAEQRKVLRITGTDKNGATISITDDNVIADSFQVDRYSCNGEKLEIGTAIAAQMTLTLENGNGTYDNIAFEGAELFVEVGVADWTQSSPTVHWVPCGYFTPDEQPRRLSTISITALDRMTKFDAVPPTLTPWTTANGDVMTTASGEIIYFVSNLSFPTTVAQLVRRTAIICNVPFTQDLSGFPNSGITIDEITTPLKEITYRNIIQWCAGIMGCNAWIDWTGALRFSWYDNTTGYSSTIDNRYSSDMYENDLTVTGVKYTTTGGIDIVEGTDDYALDITGNTLAGPIISTILSPLNTALNGFTYRPFTAAVVNAPYLWPMDAVTFTDKDGNDHDSVLTNVCFGLNGTTALESKGMTYAINKAAQPKGFTKEQAQLVNQAMENVEQSIDESLTQQEIFNRLTDNGAAQGMVLYNGQLYINASYINAGMLSVGYIGFNDVEGHYSVPNENDPTSLLPGEAISGGWIVSTDSSSEIIPLLSCDYAVPLRNQTITITFTYKTRIENGVTNYTAFDPDNGAYGEYEEYWFPMEPPYVPPNPCTYTYIVPNNADTFDLWVYGCDGVKSISVSVSGTPITPSSIKFDYAGLRIGDLLINRDGNVFLDGYFYISKPVCFNNKVTLSNALSVGSGGTGITSNPSMLVNLGSGNAANVFQASPRPGVTGALGVGNGGTGAANAADARTNLGITPANIGAVSTNGDTINGTLSIIGDFYARSADYAAIGDFSSNALIEKTSDGTVSMQSSGNASVYVYDDGDALIQSESGAASIRLSSDGDITVTGGDITVTGGDIIVTGTVKDNRILQATSAVPIPSEGISIIGLITGLTSEHQLVRWNFSSSPENAPPADLDWETYDGHFTITNNGGTTSESITPVFILPQ